MEWPAAHTLQAYHMNTEGWEGGYPIQIPKTSAHAHARSHSDLRTALPRGAQVPQSTDEKSKRNHLVGLHRRIHPRLHLQCMHPSTPIQNIVQRVSCNATYLYVMLAKGPYVALHRTKLQALASHVQCKRCHHATTPIVTGRYRGIRQCVQ